MHTCRQYANPVIDPHQANLIAMPPRTHVGGRFAAELEALGVGRRPIHDAAAAAAP